jgi:glyoxylase-like metal-dependent hydrolase (beta-lactamase superfamily II)
MMRRTFFFVLGTVAAIGGLSGASEQSEKPPVYEVYAVRYASAPGCPVAYLVKGADPARKVDLAMTFWVLKGPDGRIILVDAGCYRPSLLKSYGMADFTRPDKALERLRIKPEDVTDIILTHMHSDHVDGADLFPKAQIWIQKDEYSHYAENAKEPGGSPEPEYIIALRKLNAQGRVHLVHGDAQKIIPGVTAYTGGRHTFASQYLGVSTRAGMMVIASDNVYLYENVEKHVPIAATLDAKANLAAQDRMKQIAASPRLIIPGHDPDVFVRFPKLGDGVARLD